MSALDRGAYRGVAGSDQRPTTKACERSSSKDGSKRHCPGPLPLKLELSTGFEPMAYAFGKRCSIRLSYDSEGIRAGYRTFV